MSMSLLRKVSIFKGLPKEALQEIMSLTSSRRFNKDDAILMESEESGDTFYIINKGTVKVTRKVETDKEVILVYLKDSDFFGEMAIIDGLSRSANVISVENTEVLTLEGKDFLKILKKYPRIMLNLLKVLSGRIRRLDTHVKRLSLVNSIGKVASAILAVADYSGKKIRKGVGIENLPTLKSIADMAGVSRATVSRALGVFEKSGYIKREGHQLLIKNYCDFRNLYC